MIRSRFGYTVLIYLLLPYVLLRLWWRGRREPRYRQHRGERFGRYAADATKGCIWVHAVSVGETRATQPIIERLLQRHPDRCVLITHMTPTGRETGEQLYGDRVQRCYLPYDYPGAVARFLDRYQPALGLVMETEIWFNLIHACRTRRIPLYLANARLSEKSYRRYARFRHLACEGLNELTAVAAQSSADAQRFEALGARNAVVVGNVKFDAKVATDLVDAGRSWRVRWGAERPVWLVASTREGEEALVLEVLAHVRVDNLLTVIVPRHPQRFDEVAQLLESRGIRYWRRSAAIWPTSAVPVMLGDSMGEMFAYYAACDVAFIGGSLRPFGAHNLLEACALAKPVIVGPFVYNFQEAVELGVAAGGVVQVANAAALANEVTRILADPERCASMGQAARAFADAHRGAVDRLFALLKL